MFEQFLMFLNFFEKKKEKFENIDFNIKNVDFHSMLFWNFEFFPIWI